MNIEQWLARTDNEIETLSESTKDLQAAKQKFKESLEAIKSTKELPNGREILVPLTGSMYVPGSIVDTNKFLIDIGTDYVVERDASQSIDYFERKIKFIDVQLEKFSELIKTRLQAKQQAILKAQQVALTANTNKPSIK